MGNTLDTKPHDGSHEIDRRVDFLLKCTTKRNHTNPMRWPLIIQTIHSLHANALYNFIIYSMINDDTAKSEPTPFGSMQFVLIVIITAESVIIK